MTKRFVIHEHHARNLHFDLRLEMGGVLKSWAIPKGPSRDPAHKRLAVGVPDHALPYIAYEGTINEGKYGAGEVRIWDDGTYQTDGDPVKAYEAGKIVFVIFGLKLRGEYSLVKMKNRGDNWPLIKVDDDYADRSWELETVLEV